VSRMTYAISALLSLSGTAIAIAGIVRGEFKWFSAGFVLLLGATVFAILYLGPGWKKTPAGHPDQQP